LHDIIHRPASRPRRQRGLAALTVALIVVVVATIVTIGVTQVGVGEQRNTGNEIRNRQSSSIGDLAIDRAAAYLRNNLRYVRSTAAGGWMQSGSVKWVPCTASTVTVPCGDGSANLFDQNWTAYSNVGNLDPGGNFTASGSTPGPNGAFKAHYVARAASPGSATPGASTFYVLAEGQSKDGTGRSLIRRAFTIRPLVGRAPDAPLIAAASSNIGGTLSVVANPNGGGPGVPLSIWSGQDTDITSGATMQTCHISEYLSTDGADGTDTDITGYSLVRCPDCECPNTSDMQLSNQDREGIDILDLDLNAEGANPDTTNFPPDLFEYVFGVPAADYESIKSQATVVANCGGLGPASSGLYWVTGDCAVPSNTVIGSLDAPVAIVVDNSEFQMNANSEFMGLVFLFAHDGGSVDVKINGGPTLYGALISNQDIDLGTGNFTARYEGQVLRNLVFVAASLADVPGSWKDYR
jgi:Tfp pilus assembly protein PilX